MRNNYFDPYQKITIIGDDSYCVNYMKHLLETVNVKTYQSKKHIIDEETDKALKIIAKCTSSKYKLQEVEEPLEEQEFTNEDETIAPNLDIEDLIIQIEESLESDAVYMCNMKEELDKKTMFTLGFLMGKEKEILFWNRINKEELLMRNIQEKQGLVISPSEMKTICEIKQRVTRKTPEITTDFKNLPVTKKGISIKKQEIIPNTVSLMGSLRKQLNALKEEKDCQEENGFLVLAPQISEIKEKTNEFIIFEEDISEDPVEIETDFLKKCLSSEKIIVCDEKGYIGNTVMFEIGYLFAKEKEIELIEKPQEEWLIEILDYFTKKKKKQRTL